VPELTPEIAADVLTACQADPAETGGALSRALDATIEVTPGETGTLDVAALPEGFDGAGLVFVLKVGDIAALAIIPESSGMVPDWCAAPDATGESKLATLAQELGMLLLPEEFMPEDFLAGRVSDVAAAIERGGIETGAGLVSLALSGEDKQGTLSLIWPASKPADVLEAAEVEAPQEEPASAAPTQTQPEAAPPSQPEDEVSIASQMELAPGELPPYANSLLRIEVPVVVTLASSRQTVREILELGPGSIITFEKSCEEMLELYAGGHQVAVGEAVKVGDKFGLRVTGFRLPAERFKTLRTAGVQSD
jgi:flagellar motor switch/type III secretory pathway protein FliN